MMTILVCTILTNLVMCLSATAESRNAAQHADAPYLSIFFYNGSQITPNNQFGSQSGEGREFSGSFTARADGSIMLASIIPFEEPPVPVLYELSYIVGLHQDSDSLMLRGVIYSLDINGEDVLGGTRQVINTPIAYDEPFDMHFTPAKGQPLTIRFLMQSPAARAESDNIVYGSNTITLKTFCDAPGNAQKTSSTQPLVRTSSERRRLSNGTDSYLFEAQFTTAHGAQPQQALMYRVTVDFDPPLISADFLPRTTMKLVRKYAIDTQWRPGREPKPDWSTGKIYTKDVELMKGKMLQLVFPSDSDSLRGFVVEDTLVINP